MMRLTVPELGRLQFSIDLQFKVPILTFFLWVKGSERVNRVKRPTRHNIGHFRSGVGQISDFIFLTPKRHFLSWNDV